MPAEEHARHDVRQVQRAECSARCCAVRKRAPLFRGRTAAKRLPLITPASADREHASRRGYHYRCHISDTFILMISRFATPPQRRRRTAFASIHLLMPERYAIPRLLPFSRDSAAHARYSGAGAAAMPGGKCAKYRPMKRTRATESRRQAKNSSSNVARPKQR